MVEAIGDTPSATWLDPCVGEGAFLNALAEKGVPASRIRALDLEPTRPHSDRLARTLRPQEFLLWSARTKETFSRIVANPPYIALSRASNAVQESAASTSLPSGEVVPASANCWLAFLAASLNLLEEGGHLAFVLPAAWDFAAYAETTRADVPALFEEFDVHRSKRPLFPSVQDGSVVLVARGYLGQVSRERVARPSERFVHPDPSSLIESLTRRAATRARSTGPQKYSIEPKSLTTSELRMGTPRPSGILVRLKDVMEIRIGGVTGDAKFFVLTEDERVELRLPLESVRPIVSRARHLMSGRLNTSSWEQLRLAGEGVWLFRPSDRITEHPSVQSYLKLEAQNGGCNRNAYKIRGREPWHRTPLPSSVHGFMSGMSSWGPWVVFNDMPHLNATNTLYVVRFTNRDTMEQRAAWAMWLLTTDAQDQLSQVSREYADGLLKYEPGSLERLVATTPLRHRGAVGAYSKAVAAMLAGRRADSRAIANRWFSSR